MSQTITRQNKNMVMKNSVKRLIYILLLLAVGTGSAYAQKRIDNAIKVAEGHNTTKYCAYSERRDPSTRKILRSSKVLVISPKDAKAVRKAMDQERSKAVACEVVDGGNVYALTFFKDNVRSVYTILLQSNNTWLLTVEIFAGSRNGSRSDLDPLCPFDFDLDWNLNQMLLTMMYVD